MNSDYYRLSNAYGGTKEAFRLFPPGTIFQYDTSLTRNNGVEAQMVDNLKLLLKTLFSPNPAPWVGTPARRINLNVYSSIPATLPSTLSTYIFNFEDRDSGTNRIHVGPFNFLNTTATYSLTTSALSTSGSITTNTVPHLFGKMGDTSVNTKFFDYTLVIRGTKVYIALDNRKHSSRENNWATQNNKIGLFYLHETINGVTTMRAKFLISFS